MIPNDQALQTWPIPPRAYEVSSLVILNQAVQAEAVLAGICQAPSNMSEVLMTADKLVVNLSQLALDDGLVGQNSLKDPLKKRNDTRLTNHLVLVETTLATYTRHPCG